MTTTDVSNVVTDDWTKFPSSIIVNKSVPSSNGIFSIEFELNFISCFSTTLEGCSVSTRFIGNGPIDPL